MLNKAIELLGVKEDELELFDVLDTLNPPNTLQGFICRRGDHRYGALCITSVCGIPCAPQIIYSTPKMHYPFDKNGKFNWPKVKIVNIYDKLDGTNILAYKYQHNGTYYVTYKTRLTPVVRSGRFGAFVEMLSSLLEKYPGIPDMVLTSDWNWSFEMWGARNKHLIVYDTPLELSFLFAIDRITGKVIDPMDAIESYYLPTNGIAPAVPLKHHVTHGDITTFYQKIRAEAQAMNKETELGIEGTEGFMLYCHCDDGSVRQLKCKPEMVEAIHWAGGLSRNSIYVTCINAFEHTDNVTVDVVKALLREEFNEKDVEANHYLIQNILEEVRQENVFNDQVLAEYRAIGISIMADKRTVMRTLSTKFPRNLMSRVYWVIINKGEKEM